MLRKVKCKKLTLRFSLWKLYFHNLSPVNNIHINQHFITAAPLRVTSCRGLQVATTSTRLHLQSYQEGNLENCLSCSVMYSCGVLFKAAGTLLESCTFIISITFFLTTNTPKGFCVKQAPNSQC